jgi:hypothetical protein
MANADRIPITPPSEEEAKAALRVVALALLTQGNTFIEASIFADGIMYKIRVNIALLLEE